MTLGVGITVNALTVTDATHGMATISIDPLAATGGRLVTVTTNLETVKGLFTILSPALTQVSPNRGQQGGAHLTVALIGRSTSFGNSTIADFGAGIAVNSIAVVDATHATADIAIGPSAAVGGRTVVVTTGTESVSLPNGFAVLASCGQPASIGSGSAPTNTIVFDSDGSGRSQLCTEDLDASQVPLSSSTQITNAGGAQQQSQEPQWSLAASNGIDTIGRIAYQFGASGVRGIHIIRPDGTGDVQLTPSLNSTITSGPQIGARYPCADARDPAWSPDGQYIAYACLVNTQTTSNYDIWIHATNGTPDNPSDDFDYPLLTLSNSLELRPAWSPDNTRIAFVTNARGTVGTGTNSKIAVTQITPTSIPSNPPGSRVQFVRSIGTYTILTDDAFTNFSPSWSPDGRAIAFSSSRSGGRDIYRMSATYGTSDLGTLVRLTTSDANDTNPAWSPDGRTIAFASDRSGGNQIYVMSAFVGETDAANFHRITNDNANDNDPAWNPHTTAPQNSLSVVVSGVTVTAGVAAPTGRGTVTVSDGFGNAVSDALVTLVPPSTGSGTLAFAPAPGFTDQAGNLTFVAAEPTSQAAADYQFTVTAFDQTTARSGSATATIRVGGTAQAIPGPIPVPPQVRLPVGQPVFRHETKASFLLQSKAATVEALRDLAFDATGVSALFGPIGGAAWDAYTIQSLSSAYVRAAQYLLLANDPPDPNFAALAIPVIKAPLTIIASGGPVSINTLTLMNQSLSEKAAANAYLDALITSINRYSTALSAGDLANAALQRNAILAYEDTLALLLRTEANVTNSLIASMQADGLPNQLSASDIAALQSVVTASGLPSQISQVLLQLGLTSSDIQAIQSSFAAASAASLAGTLVASLQADAVTSQTTSVTVAQSSPAAPLSTPVITVTAGTFVYDGSAHAANAAATGVSGAPVSGSFSFTYMPGGSSAPVNVGTYDVTAQFTSADPNYSDASSTGTITITPDVSDTDNCSDGQHALRQSESSSDSSGEWSCACEWRTERRERYRAGRTLQFGDRDVVVDRKQRHSTIRPHRHAASGRTSSRGRRRVAQRRLQSERDGRDLRSRHWEMVAHSTTSIARGDRSCGYPTA